MIYLKWISFIYIFLKMNFFFKLTYCSDVAKFRKLKPQLLKFKSEIFLIT